MRNYTLFVVLAIQCFVFNGVLAQKNKSLKSDSTKTKFKIEYSKLNKSGNKKLGVFNLYKIKNDYYFEIDSSLFQKDFLVVNKISKVPYEVNGHGINKGMAYETKLIRFYQDIDTNKVWVKTLNPKATAPDHHSISESLEANAIPSVIEQFDIESMNSDSTKIVIKVNKIFDGSEKSFNDLLNNIGLGGSVKTKLSKIETIKTFEKNVVAKSLLTTSVSEGGPALPISIGVTCNIVLLPEDVMKPRFEDHRIGYFSTPMDYFNDIQQEVEHRKLITKWRLEPKYEDIERYKKGELVVPKKQIVYYIDPATPAQWIPYIEQGVRDWNVAFEQAGFKDAVVVKRVSEADKDFDIDDVRYSVIVYSASSKINAMGPSIVDPRSGEILESDIIWWHNLMKGLKGWMRVQTGPIHNEARKNVYSEQLMGEAIRFVSSHEVGHTFGLKHNMGASHSYPVDSLRSKSFNQSMGTAPSIMDYARYNYVAQPTDAFTKSHPMIGPYDKYAIEWGYRWIDRAYPHSETPILNKLIRAHENDPLYFYGAQQKEVIDPRSQSEDIGDDPVKASEYGIQNLQKIIPNLEKWTYDYGKPYYSAAKLYQQVIGQWQTYNSHVMANIGGVYINPTTYGDGRNTYTPVPKSIQEESLEYLIDYAIKPQKWLFTPDHINKFMAVKDAPDGDRYYTPISMIRDNQAHVLYHLLKTERLERLSESEVLSQTGEVLSIQELMLRLEDFIFDKTKKGKSLDIYDRITQKNYVDVLSVSRNRLLQKVQGKVVLQEHGARCSHDHHGIGDVHFSFVSRVGDVPSEKMAALRRVLKLLKKKRRRGDQMTKNHYKDLIARIEHIINK